MFIESLLCARNQVGWESGKTDTVPHAVGLGTCLAMKRGASVPLLSTTPSMPVCPHEALMLAGPHHL